MKPAFILFALTYPAFAAAATPKPVSFSVSPTIQAGLYPVFAGTADINHDGKPDVISLNLNARNATCSIVVLFGHGGGKFSTPVSTTFPGSYSSFTVADFNLDGQIDIVASNGVSLGLFLGKGNGTFQLPLTIALAQYGVAPPFAADFNGDGIPDLLVDGVQLNYRTVLIGNGDGTFQQSDALNCGMSAALADFNNDGRLDIVASCLTGVSVNVEIYLGNGDGTFTPGPEYPFSDSANKNTAVASGDFNNDGNPDFVFLETGANLFYGNGDGTFTTGPVFAANNLATWAIAQDFNGDRSPDIAFSTPGGVGLLSSNGANSFLPQITFGVPGRGAVDQPAVTDLDQNGHLDLIAASGLGSSLTVLPGIDGSTFSSPILYSPAAGIATGDFDSNGVSDVATSAGYVLLSQGNGQFSPKLVLSAARTGDSVTVADFNHDGKADVVFASDESNQNIAVVLGNGDGTFGPPVLTQLIGSPLVSMAHADFDLDGNEDVVGVSLAEGLVPGAFLLLGKGEGSFSLPLTLSTAPFSDVLAGDFNNDGKPDLVLFRHGSPQDVKGQVKLLRGNGNGSFHAAPGIDTGSYDYHSVAATDLNGDGNLDIVLLFYIPRNRTSTSATSSHLPPAISTVTANRMWPSTAIHLSFSFYAPEAELFSGKPTFSRCRSLPGMRVALKSPQ